MSQQRQSELSSTGSGSHLSGGGGNFTSEEHVVKETQTRSVPTYVDMPRRGGDLTPFSSSSSHHSLDPMTVRWDSFTPDSISAERKLMHLDQEMQRLSGEMNHLWGQSSSAAATANQASYHHPQPHTDLSLNRFLHHSSHLDREAVERNRLLNQQSLLPYHDPEMNRILRQSALDREAEMSRLWGVVGGGGLGGGGIGSLMQASSLYGGGGGVGSSIFSTMPYFEPPRGFVKLSPNAGSLSAQQRSLLSSANAALFGHDEHPETWRHKENFHVTNPVVRNPQGHRQFRLEFDLRQFHPQEIEVLSDGRVLTVKAKHEDANGGSAGGSQVRREYHRQCTIPPDVELGSLVSQLSRSGILSVSAPVSVPLEDAPRAVHIKAT